MTFSCIGMNNDAKEKKNRRESKKYQRFLYVNDPAKKNTLSLSN
jgi:hypothetical protein